MTDASGPFAVPDFSQVSSPEDDFDDEDVAETEEESEEETEEESATETRAPVEEVASSPVDGGTAQSVLEHIARSIVDEPDGVSVDSSSQRGGLRLDLHVAASDMGRIIGRRGRVAQALRSVVRAAAAKDGQDATVDIVD